ncbi:hypothetical protein FTV88_0281 [Heliorestis convoluta]|uniref:Uncharacterized protein n=1 Tax=Heliorestis convoluta TaxID=356322 RepID=A0A5Q2N290_9FIRM|nr:hypothetical protein FTV88_0281 [Heliorestis convoluta]
MHNKNSPWIIYTERAVFVFASIYLDDEIISSLTLFVFYT